MIKITKRIVSDWENQMQKPTSFWIKGFGLNAKICDYGASLADLRLDAVAHPLILGLPDETFQQHGDLYLGSTLGRVANRIGRGKFDLAGNKVALDINAPPHHLHGGTGAFSHRYWKVDDHGSGHIQLSLVSPHNDLGYPGQVEIIVLYEVVEGPALRVSFRAMSDEVTVLNLAHHPYFNLDGSATVSNHKLCVKAKHYLPTDPEGLPSGQIKSVSETDFDYLELKAFRGTALDHCFCLNQQPCGPITFAAELVGGNALRMALWTTQPGLQVYTADHFPNQVAGLEERDYGPRGGVALEAQGWPDSPNRPNFPSIALAAGSAYHQTTEYRFASNSAY